MLPRRHRVTRGDDYRHIVRTGRRRGSPPLMVYFAPTSDGEPARFGYIVSKTVGKAHERNLVRRRLKAASQELIRQGFEGANVIVRALPGAAKTSWAELTASLARSLGQQDEGRRA